MKKTLQILVGMLLVSSMSVSAQTMFSNIAPTGQLLWYYQFDDAIDSVWVVAPNATNWGSYTKPSGNLVIPDSVVRYSTTYHVKGILSYAFLECAGLRSVIVSDGIETIGIDAFKDCTGMTDITLGTNTEIINSGAFCNCSNLQWIKAKANFCLLSDTTVFEGVPNTIPVYVPCNMSLFYSALWPHFDTFVEVLPYSINVSSNHNYMGTVEVWGDPTCDSAFVTLTATPSSIYSFVGWSDGVTDNPRVVEITSDTTIIANFEYTGGNTTYTITVVSADDNMGTVTGSGTYNAYTTTTITATPYDGYRFVQWQDGNTEHIRTITVTSNATYTAYFDATNGIDDVTLVPAIYTRGQTIVIEGIAGSAVRITDMLGRTVVQANCNTSTMQFEMPSPGIYLIQVDSLPVKKIVINK